MKTIPTNSRRRARRSNRNIRRRGNSRQTRVVINGNQLAQGSPTREEAQMWLNVKCGQQLDGDLAAFHEAQRLTLARAIEKYRQHLAAPPDGAIATAVGLASVRAATRRSPARPYIIEIMTLRHRFAFSQPPPSARYRRTRSSPTAVLLSAREP